MQQANWMSLGIIVTHFAWMAQRFMSLMMPIIYASAASCRYIIACPWKHISHLPTCMAISQTSCEKGSFQIRGPVLFWNHCISQRATVTGWYFLDFFTLPACKNSFQGALPPTVGWSFLQAGSSPPNLDGLASTAILDQLSGGQWWWWLPHSFQLLCLLHLLLHLFYPWWSLLSWGWGVNWKGGLLPFSASIILPTLDHSTLFSPPLSPFLGVSFVLTMLEFRWGRLGNVEVVRPWSHKSCVVAILNFQLVQCHFGKFHQSTSHVWRRKKNRYHDWGVWKIPKDSEKGGQGI